jgi:hypothetical protein
MNAKPEADPEAGPEADKDAWDLTVPKPAGLRTHRREIGPYRSNAKNSRTEVKAIASTEWQPRLLSKTGNVTKKKWQRLCCAGRVIACPGTYSIY